MPKTGTALASTCGGFVWNRATLKRRLRRAGEAGPGSDRWVYEDESWDSGVVFGSGAIAGPVTISTSSEKGRVLGVAAGDEVGQRSQALNLPPTEESPDRCRRFRKRSIRCISVNRRARCCVIVATFQMGRLLSFHKEDALQGTLLDANNLQ